jgi:hypothetical protein
MHGARSTIQIRLRRDSISRHGGVSREDVLKAAEQMRLDLVETFARARRAHGWLGLRVGVGEGIVKVGQYAGGGGAVVFGLQAADEKDPNAQAGRNAMYSGAVAAGVTALADLLKLDNARARKTRCANLGAKRLEMLNRTRSWMVLANDDAFRAVFINEHHDPLSRELETLSRECFVE